MMHLIEHLAGDWRRLDERIEGLSADITSRRSTRGEIDTTVPSFGARNGCSKCERLGANAIANWIERRGQPEMRRS